MSERLRERHRRRRAAKCGADNPVGWQDGRRRRSGAEQTAFASPLSHAGRDVPTDCRHHIFRAAHTATPLTEMFWTQRRRAGSVAVRRGKRRNFSAPVSVFLRASASAKTLAVLRAATRHAVFPAGRRKQHASRVLHPGVAVARQRHFDASALPWPALPLDAAPARCIVPP